MTAMIAGEDFARRVLPLRLRIPAAILFVLAAIAITVLSIKYGGEKQASSLDRHGANLIYRLHLWKVFGNRVANLGGPGPIAVFAIVLTLVLLLLKRYRAVALAIISIPLAVAITEWVLKPLVGRTYNIYATAYSFPSGHTASIFATALVAVLALCDRQRPRLPAVVAFVVGLACLAVAAAVGIALINTQRHFATDVIGGFCVALATVTAVAFIVDYAFDRIMARSSRELVSRPS